MKKITQNFEEFKAEFIIAVAKCMTLQELAKTLKVISKGLHARIDNSYE